MTARLPKHRRELLKAETYERKVKDRTIRAQTLIADEGEYKDLPFGGEAELMVHEFIESGLEMEVIYLPDEEGVDKALIVMDADRAATLTASAEGAAGLHRMLDHLLNIVRDPDHDGYGEE